MTETPDWLMALADVAAGHIAPIESLAPLGCHFCFVDGVWEVSLFASDTEIVGGGRDGERMTSPFLVDVMPLLTQFDEVLDCVWQPDRFDGDDELGCHLAIIGSLADHVVCLRVLSRAPERFPPGRRTNVYDGACEDLW